MREIAKMLDVEFDKNFTCNDDYGFIYRITDKGLMCNGVVATEVLAMLLDGTMTIERKPWKPSFNERYYSVGIGGTLEPGTWQNDFIDLALYKLGNCYSAAEVAETNMSKWIDFYKTDKAVKMYTT